MCGWPHESKSIIEDSKTWSPYKDVSNGFIVTKHTNIEDIFVKIYKKQSSLPLSIPWIGGWSVFSKSPGNEGSLISSEMNPRLYNCLGQWMFLRWSLISTWGSLRGYLYAFAFFPADGYPWWYLYGWIMVNPGKSWYREHEECDDWINETKSIFPGCLDFNLWDMADMVVQTHQSVCTPRST